MSFLFVKELMGIKKKFPDSDVFEMENSDYKYRSYIQKTGVLNKL